MAYDSESDLKYIDSLDSIPVTGEGVGRNWSDEDKLEAAEAGEEKLEADINDGSTIGSPQPLHGEAAATWATYKLVLGMKSPDSATRGDTLDEGTERMNFVDRVKSMYDEYISSISHSAEDESDDSSQAVGFEVIDL